MRIAVQGIGVVGGFGAGADQFRQALASGASHLGSCHLANCGSPLELPAFMADTDRLKDFVPLRALRRIDHFSRLGLLAAHLALEDAGVLAEGKQERLGVIVATGFGATGIIFAFQDSFINDGDICASPTHFANSVHNSAAASISIMLGATGPSSTISQFHLSTPSALQTAWQWLTEGRVDRVLFGAVDELSELMGYLWYRRRGASPTGEMTPLLAGADSAIPGEGAAFMLLSRKEEAQPGYCLIDSVATGRHAAPWTPDSPQELLVIGADGRREHGAQYATLAAGAHLACFTPLYGSAPTGPAFDIAAAALMLKEGVTFATPYGDRSDFPSHVVPGGVPVATGRISCITIGEDNGFGVTTLKKL